MKFVIFLIASLLPVLGLAESEEGKSATSGKVEQASEDIQTADSSTKDPTTVWSTWGTYNNESSFIFKDRTGAVRLLDKLPSPPSTIYQVPEGTILHAAMPAQVATTDERIVAENKAFKNQADTLKILMERIKELEERLVALEDALKKAEGKK